jgi:DMSO/TMAO reductase YedYZ molybdopterin-dependent catalytic subunit
VTKRPRTAVDGGRLPPGQVETRKFPVLSASPTPEVRLADYAFVVKVGPRPVARFSFTELDALPKTSTRCDLHCVTTWSKFDTHWEGVSIDDLLAAAGLAPPTPFALIHSVDGYSTNVPTADLVGGKAMIALRYEGLPIPPDHGGPARLLVPHLYFWKSAKWVNGIQFTARDEAGFWELRGYHMRGDPWREQRYTEDP